MEDRTLMGATEPVCRLELTAAQLKITHTALMVLMQDFGHEEHDVRGVIREVLGKLPDEHDISAIDLTREISRRRAVI